MKKCTEEDRQRNKRKSELDNNEFLPHPFSRLIPLSLEKCI
jgi:hypothetical protein